MASGLKLAPLLTEIKVDIKGFKSQMEQAKTAGVSEAKKISDQLSGVTKVGDRLSGMGGALTKGLSVPLVSAGVAAGKMAVDYETNFAKVSTLLDKNQVDYKQYSNDLLDASSNSKVAVGEFSEAVYGSISAGVDQSKAIGFTTDAMKLAKGGFTDGAKAVDVLTTAINGYGLQSEDATKLSDMLITTQNLGKTTVDELASSMGAVIPVASSVNFGMDELSAAYAQLTKNGIATAESGTYLKSMLSELGKSGSESDKVLRELTGKGFADLKKEGKSTSDILQLLDGYAQDNGKSLKDMFGSVEAGSAALVLAKGDGQEYNGMLSAMQSSAGATQEAFDKMDSTPAEKMKGALNELKNGAVKLGEAFIPVVENIADKLSGLADWFGNLSEEQRTNAVQWGAVLAVAGPVLKVVGGGIKTFTDLGSAVGGLTKFLGVAGSGSAASGLIGGLGALSSVALPIAGVIAGVGTAIYAVHEHGDLMNSTITKSRDEMSWMEKVMADLSGTTTYTKEELEEMGYVHKDFSENISPEFQKAVEDADQDIQNFNISLQETSFDGVLTQEESDGLRQRVNDTISNAVNTINSRKEEVQNSLSDTFNADGMISEDERTLLDYYKGKYDTATTEETKIKKEIYEILDRAKEEKRSLNDEELRRLEEYYAEAHRIELEATGESQEEIMYAKNEFLARVENMDLDSASKLLQEKAELRNEEIVKIKAGYDTEIERLQEALHSKNREVRTAAENEIAQLEKDKQEKISQQNDLYAQYMGVIRENNPKMLEEINKFTGEQLSQGERAKEEQLKTTAETYDGMNRIQESGYYTLLNKMTGHYENVTVMVDESTGEIVAAYSETNGALGAYCDEMGKNAEEMAKRQDKAFQAIMGKEVYYVESTQEFVDSSGERVTAIGGIQTQADGTKTAILELNGTPVNVVVDENGTCRQILDDIATKSCDASGDRYLTYHVTTQYTVGSDEYYEAWGRHHYNGLDNVPYDGYRAVLHKDERVLTAEENKEYAGGQKQTVINFNGNYGFKDKADMDYFMNQAALRLAGARA